MSHAENVTTLRTKLVKAMQLGLIEGESADNIQTTLIQMLNEGERRRQKHVQEAIRLEKLAVAENSKASGYAQVASLMYDVLDGQLRGAAKAAAEETRIKKEKILTDEEQARLDKVAKEQEKKSKSKTTKKSIKVAKK